MKYYTYISICSYVPTGCLSEELTSLLQNFVVEMLTLHANTLYIPTYTLRIFDLAKVFFARSKESLSGDDDDLLTT